MSDRFDARETCTMEQVLDRSAEWCAKHPAWVRICDTPNGFSDSLHVQWGELNPTAQARWGSEFAYAEFARKRCKVPVGVVSGKGEFYENICDVPLFHNSMCVFRVGAKVAREMAEQRANAAAALPAPQPKEQS